MIEILNLENKTIKKLGDKLNINRNSKNWISLTNPTKEELKDIEKKFNLHKTTIEEFSEHKIISKIEEFDNYLLIRLVNAEIVETKIKVEQITIVLDKNTLITSTTNKINFIEKLKKDQRTLNEILNKGPDFLLNTIIEKTITNYFPLIENLDNELDTLENQALKNPEHKVLERLFRIKRELIKLRRILYPKREVLSNLLNNQTKLIDKEIKTYFRDSYDNLLVIIDLVEDQRDRINSILEVHLSVTSNKLNEIMKVLTIISTILIPLTFIASIYGMNFKNMPELDWRYGYFLVLGIMGIILLITILYIKKKKWI